MRHYPANSPRAIARVLALTILADGGLDVAELRVLKNYDLTHRLNLGEAEFDEVMRDFCHDLMQFAEGDYYTHLVLERELIGQLLSDINDPSLQMTLLRIMLDIVNADGTLAGGEAVLLSEAMLNWGLDLHHAGLRLQNRSSRGARFGRRAADRGGPLRTPATI
jgi:hypothetical protein